jgi:hypothetical protein
VGCTQRNIHDVAAAERKFSSFQGYFRNSSNHHPVLSALLVLLVAQAVSGKDLNTLNLVTCAFVKHGKTAPGTFFVRHASENTLRPYMGATPQHTLDWPMRR